MKKLLDFEFISFMTQKKEERNHKKNKNTDQKKEDRNRIDKASKT